MKELMQGLRDSSIKAILEADDIELLESLRVKYLGKKGELTGILRQMGKLSAEERPVMGQLANQLRGDIEAAIEQRKAELGSKLMELKIQQHAEKISDLKGVQLKIEWGSQIRSYVFMPYQLVKDTRTDYETGNIQAVMDGDLDGFINAYLTKAANGELKK